MIRVTSFNTRGGWTNKYDHDQIMILLEESDILAILDPGIVKQEVHLVSIKGFTCYPLLHPSGDLDDYCGGILLYIRDSLDPAVTVLAQNHNSYKDLIWLKLSNWLMGFAYLPPSASSFAPLWHSNHSPVEVFFTDLLSTERSQPHCNHILTMGDYNTRLSRSPDSRTNTWGSQWKRCATQYGFTERDFSIIEPQEYTFFSTQGNSTIDSAYSNAPELATLETGTYCPALSDHVPLTLTKTVTSLTHTPPRFFPYPTILQAIKQSSRKPPALLDPLGKDFINQQEAALLQLLKAKPAPSSSPPTSIFTAPAPTSPSYPPVEADPTPWTADDTDDSEQELNSGPDFSRMSKSAIQNLISRYHARVKKGQTLSDAEAREYQCARSAQRAHRQRVQCKKKKRLLDQAAALRDDPKRYWQHIKRILNNSKRIKADPTAALEHMKALSAAHSGLDVSGTHVSHPRILFHPPSDGAVETLVDDPLTAEEIAAALGRMRNSASGEDGVTVEMLKMVPMDDLVRFFADI